MNQLELDASPIPTFMPVALVRGHAFTDLPQDLYIPPDALEVFLEAFEGPLDLLLYLIKKQNLDILDIPIAEITRQYQEYIELMQELKLELAAEYLLMAAVLAEIKSRLLLPRPATNAEEEDPRAELVRRLKEYEQFKKAAEDLDALPRVDRDVLPVQLPEIEAVVPKVLPFIELGELMTALQDVLNRATWRTPHLIRRELLSVRERMTYVLLKLQDPDVTVFTQLLVSEQGRLGVVVTLIAVLELLKQSAVKIMQAHAYAPLYVQRHGVGAEISVDEMIVEEESIV